MPAAKPISRRALVGLGLGAALGLTVGLVAQVQAAPTATMSVDDVRPGMKGYAVTVFSGSDTDRFEIEVIDVVRDYQPKQDAILFRSSDPRMVHSGIVGGMSGSPIYIDGKLVGALAYGYRFNKDPIGGITPIKNMLAVGDLPYRPEVLPEARTGIRGGIHSKARAGAPSPRRARPRQRPRPARRADVRQRLRHRGHAHARRPARPGPGARRLRPRHVLGDRL